MESIRLHHEFTCYKTFVRLSAAERSGAKSKPVQRLTCFDSVSTNNVETALSMTSGAAVSVKPSNDNDVKELKRYR